MQKTSAPTADCGLNGGRKAELTNLYVRRDLNAIG